MFSLYEAGKHCIVFKRYIEYTYFKFQAMCNRHFKTFYFLNFYVHSCIQQIFAKHL